MKDEKTLAYINMYAILGTLVQLCQTDEEAKALIKDKNVSIGFAVKNGPSVTLIFSDGKCSFVEGVDKCDIKLPFKTPEKFNGMINGEVTPIPSKGFTKLGFLTKTFTKLTDILTKYLKPDPKDLENEDFFNTSTKLMLHVIASACAQIGNYDKIGRTSASYIKDGIIKLEIGDDIALGVSAKNHFLTAIHNQPEEFSSYMHFSDMKLARSLFDGKVNAILCIGDGKIRVGGMISQVDNINRILDRVSVYLA